MFSAIRYTHMLTHSLTLLPGGGGGGSGGALSTALYDFDGQDGELSFKVLYMLIS